MSRDPHVIGVTRPITGASIIWPIANRDRDGAWITTVIGSRRAIAIVRSVSWISCVSPFTSRCTKGGKNQNQHECEPFQSRFFFTLCGNYFRLPMIDNFPFHTLSIRITNSLYAPVSIERAPGRGKKGVDRKAATRRLDRASHPQLSQTQRCLRQPQDCLGARTRLQFPKRFYGSWT